MEQQYEHQQTFGVLEHHKSLRKKKVKKKKKKEKKEEEKVFKRRKKEKKVCQKERSFQKPYHPFQQQNKSIKTIPNVVSARNIIHFTPS